MVTRRGKFGQLVAAYLVALLFATPAIAAGTIAQGAKMFKDTTYQELQPYAAADRLVAVIRCEAIETVSPGSRSERQQIRGSLLAGPAGMAVGNEVLLSRFAQGGPLMAVGTSYLIAAYKESVNGPWTLLENREVQAEAASKELQAAAAEVSRRLGKPATR